MASVLQIRRLGSADVKAAVALWWVTDLLKPWNDPNADAERALATPTSTILAGFLNDQLVATGMVGSDGHRGWVYYLAVSPGHQRCGFGRQMMAACEAWIEDLGIAKIQVTVRSEDHDTAKFYRRIGYDAGEQIFFSKRLGQDDPEE